MLGEVEVIASDTSGEATDLARENAVAQGVGDRVAVAPADLLPAAGQVAGLLVVPARFDVICANLPYIPSSVVPALAVAASLSPSRRSRGPTGSAFAACWVLPERVAAAGVALLEIGDEQGPSLRAAAAARLPGWDVRVEPDLAGRLRVAVLDAPVAPVAVPAPPA
jgi:methylase of polypeptide subunit release factors